MLRQLVDAFTMLPSLRQHPYDFRALAIGQMDTLRRAKGYRPKLYATPDLTDPAIAAADTIQRQIAIKPGTYIWGVSVVLLYGSSQSYNGGNSYTGSIGLSNFYVRDDGTGIPLWDDFIGDYIFSPVDFSPQGSYGGAYPFTASIGSPSGANYSMQPTILTQPRLINDPGLVTVMISNSTPWLSGAGIKSQLILHCAEPCEELRQECDPCNI